MRDVQADTAPPTLTVDAALARVKREQMARKAAEAIIEAKSQELHEANEQLELLLTGSVKLLTDILAMARPEVFQKAAKVQRWARRLSKHLDIEKPWELDLATILYPIGVISLSDEVAMKYALDSPLAPDEQKQLAESPMAAYRLVHNIPRMDSVARAILYSRKGFDGSGFPQDDVRGQELPQTARILKILVDLADAATGVSRSRTDAFAQMAGRKSQYDLDILKVAYQVLLEQYHDVEEGDEVLELRPSLLRAGDVVHKDIVDLNGKLLLAAGAELTDLSIKRLATLHAQRQLADEISIKRVQATSKGVH